MAPAMDMDPVAPGPWWMEGVYAPVSHEAEAFDLTVEGALPPELVGTYLRNGPNPHAEASKHWFGGDGMVHGVRLSGGRAEWYRNRYITTPMFEEREAPLGPPPLDHHPANISLIQHADRLLALGETGLPFELRPGDLSTLGAYDYQSRLATAMTAHPKIDPVTGRMHFFGYGFLPPYLTYHVAEADGTLSHSARIEIPAPVMMHDLAITETRVIFLDMPVVFDFNLALAGDDFPFRWRPENGTRLGIMPHDGTNDDVIWIEIDPCYVFHTLNAWDDPTDPARVVLEAVRHLDLFVDGVHQVGHDPQLWRWTLDLNTGVVSDGPIDEPFVEFPMVDRRRWGRPHRHGYALARLGAGGGADEQTLDTVMRYGADGVDARYTFSDGWVVDEQMFVPRSPDAAEGDGWLMGYSHAPDGSQSVLSVIEAGDIAAGPIARVHMPHRVPVGLHGLWSPG